LAFGVIYGYLRFDSAWRRIVLVLAGIPLAVVANVFRLTLIILAAEAFGQQAGDYVHESTWLSMAPYVPSIGGVLLLGWWISEERRAKSREKTGTADAPPTAEIKSTQ
jgi:exosortase/archaeosortase family protein